MLHTHTPSQLFDHPPSFSQPQFEAKTAFTSAIKVSSTRSAGTDNKSAEEETVGNNGDQTSPNKTTGANQSWNESWNGRPTERQQDLKTNELNAMKIYSSITLLSPLSLTRSFS